MKCSHVLALIALAACVFDEAGLEASTSRPKATPPPGGGRKAAVQVSHPPPTPSLTQAQSHRINKPSQTLSTSASQRRGHQPDSEAKIKVLVATPVPTATETTSRGPKPRKAGPRGPTTSAPVSPVPTLPSSTSPTSTSPIPRRPSRSTSTELAPSPVDSDHLLRPRGSIIPRTDVNRSGADTSPTAIIPSERLEQGLPTRPVPGAAPLPHRPVDLQKRAETIPIPEEQGAPTRVIPGTAPLPRRPADLQKYSETIPGPKIENGETTLTAWNGKAGDFSYCDQVSVTVPWTGATASWRFCWKTTVPDVRSGRWEISTTPIGKPSENSKGANVLAEGNAGASAKPFTNGMGTFWIDFATFATIAKANGEFPHTFYLRVLPLNSAGKTIGSPSNNVRIERQKIFEGNTAPSKTTLRAWNGQKAPEFIAYDKLSTSLDWHADPAAWDFQWKTTQQNYKSIIYQVSSLPFVTSGGDVLHPAGLVATGPADTKAPASTVFTVNFSSFAPSPKHSTQLVKSLPNPKNATAAAKLDLASFTKNLEKYRSTPSGKLPHLDHKPLHNPDAGGFHTNFFVRVVTVGANGKPAGEPSNSVTVSFGDPSPQAPITVEPAPAKAPTPIDGLLPDVKVVSYTPRSLGDFCHVIITNFYLPDEQPCLKAKMENGEISIWSHIDLCAEEANCPDEDKGFFEKAFDDLKAAVGVLGDAINAVAKAYNDAKSNIIAATASMFCPPEEQTDCTTALELAMDTGLAAMGLPPSLPNTDQLTKEGEDYLAQYMADQTGIPSDAAKVMVEETGEAAKTALAGTPSDPNGWYKPDPAFAGYHPAKLVFEVSYPASAPQSGGKPKYAKTLRAAMRVNEEKNLFINANIPLPALSPGMSVRVPVSLLEDDNAVALPTDALQSQVEGRWAAAYEKGISFHVAVSAAGTSKMLNFSQPGTQPFSAQ